MGGCKEYTGPAYQYILYVAFAVLSYDYDQEIVMQDVSVAWDPTYFIWAIAVLFTCLLAGGECLHSSSGLLQCYSAVCFRVGNAYTVHLGNCSAIQLFACGWGMLTQFIWAIALLFTCLLAGGQCLHFLYFGL